MSKKKQHGGRRKGAGRNPVHEEGKTVPIKAMVPEQLVSKLTARAKEEKLSRSQVITSLIRSFVKGKS